MRAAHLFIGLALATGLWACDGGAIDIDVSPSSPTAEGLFLLIEGAPPALHRLDLNSGETNIAFEGSSLSFIYELDVERQSGDVMISFTPPPAADEAGFARSGIYRLSGDGELARAVCADEPNVWCFYPALAANSVWFVRSGVGVGDDVDLSMWRTDIETGETQTIIDWGTEPAVSPDGDQLAWIQVSPFDGSRTLELADAEGNWIRTLLIPTAGSDIGQPFFSADGDSVFFLSIPAATVSLGERLRQLFVGTAYAHDNHDMPSDWFQVDVRGDEPARQVTDLQIIQYDGCADPGGDWIFVMTQVGVQQVRISDGEATLLMATRSGRALDWY